MDANRKEVDPFGQELIEGSNIAGEISSVNHRTPCPSAPHIEGRVKKRASKRAAVHIKQHNMKRKINKIGEMSTGQDGLQELRGVNQAPIMSSEQNGQTVQPLVVASQNVKSPAHEIQKAKKRVADKKFRDEQKRKIKETARRLEKMTADNDVLNNRIAYLNGKLDQIQNDREAFRQQRQQTIEQQNTRINMLLQLLLPGTTGFDTGETGSPVVHYPTINQSGATMESGGPVIAESLPQLHQMGRPYNHGQGNTPFNMQLPFEVTEFETGKTGLPVHQSGTTMGTGGLAVEDSLGLPQSHVSQGWTHVLNDYTNHGQGNTPFNMQLPSYGIGDKGSTSFQEDMDYLMNLGIASHECHRQETESVLEPPSHD